MDCGGWGREVFTTSQNVDQVLVTISPFTPQPHHHYLSHLVTWPRWPAAADCETVVNWAATDISRIESNNQGREETFPCPWLAADRCIVTCCVRCCQNTHHTTLNTALKVRGKVSVMGFVLSDCAVVWSTGNVNMPWPYLDLGQDDDYRHELYVKHNPIFLYRTKLYGNQVSQTGCTGCWEGSQLFPVITLCRSPCYLLLMIEQVFHVHFLSGSKHQRCFLQICELKVTNNAQSELLERCDQSGDMWPVAACVTCLSSSELIPNSSAPAARLLHELGANYFINSIPEYLSI